MRKLSYSFKSIGISLRLVGKRSYRKKKNYSHPHFFIYVKHYALSTRLTLFFVGDKAKVRISKRVFQENKACQIFRNTNISYPLISEDKKCSFFGKFGQLCFLETPVLRFSLLPYCRCFVLSHKN